MMDDLSSGFATQFYWLLAIVTFLVVASLAIPLLLGGSQILWRSAKLASLILSAATVVYLSFRVEDGIKSTYNPILSGLINEQKDTFLTVTTDLKIKECMNFQKQLDRCDALRRLERRVIADVNFNSFPIAYFEEKSRQIFDCEKMSDLDKHICRLNKIYSEFHYKSHFDRDSMFLVAINMPLFVAFLLSLSIAEATFQLSVAVKDQRQKQNDKFDFGTQNGQSQDRCEAQPNEIEADSLENDGVQRRAQETRSSRPNIG